MDVRSLYTNIPNDEGIEALRESLHNYQCKTTTTKIVTTLMWLILTLNNFVFNGINYLQVKGIAMGTNASSSYSTIYMAKFEGTYIIGLYTTYLRYIDDIFMIWTDTKEKFEQFIKELNLKHPSIKSDCKISAKEVDFLDITVYIDKNNRLQTKLYKKPTDRQNYLHRKSEHPESLKKSIPHSQALRIKRICSNDEELKNSCKALKNERGYDEQETEQQITRASEMP